MLINKIVKHNETPIWFMRQAGRYLPEYQVIRKKQKSFLDLCFNPSLAAEISLQPINRFDLDAIILFSDILVIPYALNQSVDFVEGKGPILGDFGTLDKLEKMNLNHQLKKISSVFKTLELLKQKKKNKTLIGFCGAPFTVMNYMIERGTSKKHEKIKKFIKTQNNQAKRLIKIIQEISVMYIIEQIKSGAEVIKIFDSWAGLLNGNDYNTYVIEPNLFIFKEIKKKFKHIPLIFFPRNSGKNIINFINQINCDILSVDENYPNEIKQIAKKKNIVLQGNLNPNVLLNGGKKMEKEIKKILFDFRENKHIFNLSHGILPKTPIYNVQKTVEIVRNNEFKRNSSNVTI